MQAGQAAKSGMTQKASGDWSLRSTRTKHMHSHTKRDHDHGHTLSLYHDPDGTGGRAPQASTTAIRELDHRQNPRGDRAQRGGKALGLMSDGPARRLRHRCAASEGGC